MSRRKYSKSRCLVFFVGGGREGKGRERSDGTERFFRGSIDSIRERVSRRAGRPRVGGKSRGRRVAARCLPRVAARTCGTVGPRPR
jgi:hypothetical protein